MMFAAGAGLLTSSSTSAETSRVRGQHLVVGSSVCGGNK